MAPTNIAIIFALCIGASFVQRVSGFGFGIFIMTVLPFVMPSYAEATTLSGILSCLQSMVVLRQLWRIIPWKRLLPILLAFIVCSYIAIGFVASINDHLLKKVLGIILIILSLYFLFINSRLHIRPTIPMSLTMGSLSGVLGGLSGMQGPPAVLYFIASEKTKESYMAISQAYFCIGNLMMTFFRAQHGFLTPTVAQACLYSIVAIFIGTYLGRKVFDRISANILTKIIYAYMGIAGIIVLITSH